MAGVRSGGPRPTPATVAELLAHVPEVDLAAGLGPRRFAALQRLVSRRARGRAAAALAVAALTLLGLALLLG